MRTFVSIFAAAIVLVGCKPSVDIEKERGALLATDSEWMHSANDASKFASYYTADASFYPSGIPVVKGQAAIRDTFKQINSAPGFALEWHIVQSKVAAGGDIAYTAGTYQLKATGGGEKGKYVTVWAKQADGNWRVTDDIFNSDEPPPPPPLPAPGEHTLLAPSKLTWSPAPLPLPPGAKFAVLSGDPSKAEPFTVRLEMPAGYAVAPHWHPTDEHVTVLAGKFALGMGDTLDKAAATELPVGGYALLPAKMHHYAFAKTAATVQVHATGPFVINYVNPADDPSRPKN
jgi:ketosteroid isomerase-like protein